MKIMALFALTVVVSLARAASFDFLAFIDGQEAKVKAARSMTVKVSVVKDLEKKMTEAENQLLRTSSAAELEIVSYNMAFGPIYHADFLKDKRTCQEGGLKQDILALYHQARIPPHARRALRFLAAVCGRPRLSEINESL